RMVNHVRPAVRSTLRRFFSIASLILCSWARMASLILLALALSLTADVGVVHQHGLDAVFSVLYTICTLDEALANAAANLRMTARNVAAVLQMGGKL
ncbi:glycerate kinase, partial [Klebsiella quasipneumoniae]|uniref:glycerate kinase n=1 Tax=Klebsiella quasipneumoniae TaxID=1463165 RepID=UPI003BF73BA0